MNHSFRWQFFLGLILVALSATVYFIHFLIFRDAHHIFIYLISDIAFVFLEVLMVSIVIHQLLVQREKQALLNKLNMVIGAFFSEVGLQLIKILAHFLIQSDEIEDKLKATKEWTAKDFFQKNNFFKEYVFKLDSRQGDLGILKDFLLAKRSFLLNLLENPNLMEHENFTNCLWAVFHLTEELSFRKAFNSLPDSDFDHLSGDMKRVYKQLVCQWISYMKHLKVDYPYLFSLAARTNPFDKDASIIVQR